jgi:hypothetical protein
MGLIFGIYQTIFWDIRVYSISNLTPLEMTPFINCLVSAKTRVLFFCFLSLLLSNDLFSQSTPNKKVRLLVVINTTTPLTVSYQSLAQRITGQAVSSTLSVLFGFYIPSFRAPVHFYNKDFQENVGDFNRFEIVKDSLLKCFTPVSEYFSIDVANDRSAEKETHWFDLDDPRWKGYKYILFIDEVYPGLQTRGQLGTLSATDQLRYELFDVVKRDRMHTEFFIGSHPNKRSKEQAILDADAFKREYPTALTIVLKAFYQRLSWSGMLHKMAESQGLGEFVPTFESYYNIWKHGYDLHVSSPKGWDVGEFKGSEAKFINPRDRFYASKIMAGRVDVALLTSDMKTVKSVQQYADEKIRGLLNGGAMKDDSTKLEIVFRPEDAHFIVRDKNGITRLFVIRKTGEIYALIFEFAVAEDFEKYMHEYKNDIEAIIYRKTKLKV